MTTHPKLTILFSGMIAGVPHQGGATWAVLQYLLGFRQLGHAVYFIEPVEESALQPAGAPLTCTANAAYFGQVMAEFGLTQHAALLLAGTRETVGLPYDRIQQIARRADLLVNISGMLADEQLLEPIPVRVYLDLDPVFNQFWHAVYDIDMCFANHTHHVTVGLNLGSPDCPVPTCDLDWMPTLQPVVLDRWPVAGPMIHDGFTTVANWRGYGSVEHEGIFYGQKVHSWRQFMALPRLTGEKFAAALAIHPAETQDLAALRENGWRMLDPARVAHTPAAYRRFVQGSKAELGIAKDGYVTANSGWFSDRSVCYLASGRPVVAQETGFSSHLPTGEGLFAFETYDDVLLSIETLRREYERQAQAARAIAESYFDANLVLPRLLQRIEITG